MHSRPLILERKAFFKSLSKICEKLNANCFVVFSIFSVEGSKRKILCIICNRITITKLNGIKFASMFPDNVYDIEELSSDDRALFARKYRKYLHCIAQAAIWTAYIYFAVRLCFTLRTPDRTWKMWVMLGVEGLFARKFSNKKH